MLEWFCVYTLKKNLNLVIVKLTFDKVHLHKNCITPMRRNEVETIPKYAEEIVESNSNVLIKRTLKVTQIGGFL